jgi:hypothetical protein
MDLHGAIEFYYAGGLCIRVNVPITPQ